MGSATQIGPWLSPRLPDRWRSAGTRVLHRVASWARALRAARARARLERELRLRLSELGRATYRFSRGPRVPGPPPEWLRHPRAQQLGAEISRLRNELEALDRRAAQGAPA